MVAALRLAILPLLVAFALAAGVDEKLELQRIKDIVSNMFLGAANNDPTIDEVDRECRKNNNCQDCLKSGLCSYAALKSFGMTLHNFNGCRAKGTNVTCEEHPYPKLDALICAVPDVYLVSFDDANDSRCGKTVASLDVNIEECEDCKSMWCTNNCTAVWCYVDAYDPSGRALHSEVCTNANFCKMAEMFGPEGSDVKTYFIERSGPNATECSSVHVTTRGPKTETTTETPSIIPSSNLPSDSTTDKQKNPDDGDDQDKTELKDPSNTNGAARSFGSLGFVAVVMTLMTTA